MCSARPRTAHGKTQGPNLLTFLLDSQSCIIDRETASRLRLGPGSIIGTSKGPFRILSTFPSPSPEPLMVTDISHAQRIFRLSGHIDRVDLVLSDEKAFRTRFGNGFRIQSVREKERLYSGMLDAFRLNLEALSLIALFVGVFLIYNTTMFSVISRRKDAGILRSPGGEPAGDRHSPFSLRYSCSVCRAGSLEVFSGTS